MGYPQPGDIVGGKYRVLEVVGEGGFGVVYRATAEHSGRPVAIKLLKHKSGEQGRASAARFRREMRVIAGLEAPETLTLFDYGETAEGLPYMVTEYVQGEDLSEVLGRRGRLSEGEVLHILVQVLYSLQEAHAAGVVHRDLKPGNIRLYEFDGDPLRVKVLDFGIARAADGVSGKVTQTGNVVGTPRYMAPEQFLTDEIAPTIDVYSLGVVAAEMLGGREVVDRAGANPVGRRVQLGEEDNVGDAVRDIVNRMLEADPAARYRDGGEVLSAVRPLRRETARLPRAAPVAVWSEPGPQPAPLAPPTMLERTPSAAKRGWVGVVVAAGVLLVVFVVGVRSGKHNRAVDDAKLPPAEIVETPMALVDAPYYEGLDSLADGEWFVALEHFHTASKGDGVPDDIDEHIDLAMENVVKRSPHEVSRALQLFPERGSQVATWQAGSLGRTAREAALDSARALAEWRAPRLRTDRKFDRSLLASREEGIAVALRMNPSIGACDDGSVDEVEVEVMVAPSGRIHHAEVVSNGVATRVRDCLVRALEGTKVPESEGGGAGTGRLTTNSGERVRVPNGTMAWLVELW